MELLSTNKPTKPSLSYGSSWTKDEVSSLMLCNNPSKKLSQLERKPRDLRIREPSKIH